MSPDVGLPSRTQSPKTATEMRIEVDEIWGWAARNAFVWPSKRGERGDLIAAYSSFK